MLTLNDSIVAPSDPPTSPLDVTGIPQSGANPLVAEMLRPAREQDAAVEQWRTESRQKIDAAALDFSSFDPGADEWVRKRTLVSSLMQVESDEDPGDGLAYEMLRDQTADRLFEGRGRGSDDAFFAELQKSAQGRKDAKVLDKTLTEAAALSATVQATDFFSRDLSTYAQWRDKARTSPGYDPKKEPQYLEAFEDQKDAVRRGVEPYLGPLSQVWGRIKSDDVGAEVQRAYFQIPPDERGNFMASLAILARGLPKEEQPKFWANVAKQSGRDISGFVGDAKTGTQGVVMQGGTVGMNELLSYGESDFGPLVKRQNRDRQAYENFRRSSDFLADVRRVQQQDFDPLKYLNPEGSALQFGERIAYGAPGAAATSLAAAIPGVGMSAFYAASQESIYQDYRQTFQAAGMNYDQARARAEALAPIAAIPQVLMENLQIEAVAGKLPAFEKLLGGLSDRLKNRALRFGARAAIGAVEEGVLEQAQDYIPPLVQDMANALGSDVPDVNWSNGKDGVLDGWWADTGVMIGTMLPMALFGAAGGVSSDARNRAFAQRTDTELEAFFGSKEAVSNIRAAEAKGDYSLGQAIDGAFTIRDPFSDTAKAAVEQLKADAAAQQQVAQEAQRSGVLPRFVRDAEGWTVYDGETQEEVGKAPDAAGALKLAETHSAAIDRKDADMVAYLATMLEAGDTQNAGDGEKRQTTTDFRPGEAVTTAQQSLASPVDESRVAAQVAAKERLNGGDGSMAQLVLGQSTTETKQRVRRTVNRLNAGASVLTVFHEEAHGFFREALATGRLTKDETISTIRALETVLSDRKAKDGQALRFLPENDADIDDTALDEAVSELVEAEVLRTRKDGGARQLPGGIISRNLTAAAKLSGGARKFSAFIAAVRAYFGLAFSRAVAIRQGIKEGKIDKAKLDEFTTKLFGLNEQDEHEAAAVKEAASIVGEEIEGDPFSLGPAALADAIIAKATAKIKDPQQKAKVFTGIVERMGKLRRDKDEILSSFGKEHQRKAINEPRDLKSINREAGVREALRRAELEDEAHARHVGILSAPELAKLKEQSVHAHLADPVSPLKGRLRSRAEAARSEFFDDRVGDYDGADGVSRTVFGGSLMPDQAAQELFEAGLIAEPTPDALWNALIKESASVAKMKGFLKAAEADLKAARTTAKAEADAWKRERVAEQKANYSPKVRLLRAFAMLDGILMAMPVELRGKVGGYTQLAKLNTDEKRLEFLQGRIEKVDKVVEKWLQGEASKMLDKLLERAEPKKEGGKKPKGKLGAVAHRFFDQVEEMRGKTDTEVEAVLAELDKAIGSTSDTTELADLAERYQIAVAFGNFKEKPAAEMLRSIDLAAEVYQSGRNAWKTLEEARLAESKGLAVQGLRELGKNSPAAVQRGKKESAKLIRQVQGGKWSFYSFIEVMEGVYGRDSVLAKRWGKAVRDGFRNRTAGIIAAQGRWKEATEAATGKTGLKARQQVFSMANDFTIKATPTPIAKETLRVPIDTFFDAEQQKSLGLSKEEIAQLTEQFENLPEGSRKEYLTLERVTLKETEAAEFTEAEGVYLSMLWSQDGYKKGMRLHGLGDDFQSELESQLSDAAKGIRAHLSREYADNFEPLRALFARMFGVDLPKTENYTPGKFYSQGQESSMDVTGSGFVEGGFKQGFLKDRKKHSAEARAENAFAVYFAHLNQTEHWKALAEVSREMHAVLGNPEMKKALLAKNADAAKALSEWLKAIDGNGFNNAPESWLLDSLLKSQAYLAMAWKASTILKNGIGAAINSAYKMPPKAFFQGYARLIAGKIEFSKVWDSDLIQNRIKGGFAPEARAAISSAFMAKPTLRGDLLLKGMEVIGTADSFGTACGAAVAYDYHLREARRAGLSMLDAETAAMDKAAEIVARTAQPAEVTDRSLMELRLHGIGRLAFVFASEARQKSALWLTAWGNTLTGKPTANDLRVLVISHLVMGPLMQAISAMVRDSLHHDDDEWFDEKYWNPKDFYKAIATGPLSGLPLVRDVFDGYAGDSGPLKRMVDSAKSAKKLFADEPKGDKADWYEQQIVKVLQGLGPSPAVGASVFDQVYDFLRNATD